MEDTLLEQLKPIFPNLTEEVILLSIRHPSNNTDPLSPQSVFMSCIDDLLQLRTFSLASIEPQKKQTSSSDEDDSLMKAAEKVEKELNSLAESKQRALKAKDQAKQLTDIKGSDTGLKQLPSAVALSKQFIDAEESNTSLKQLPSTSAQSKHFTDTKKLDTDLKQTPSTSTVCNSGNLGSLSYQTARKDAIDSGDSSNDSLPDPCFSTKKSQPDPSINIKNSKPVFTSSASAPVHNPNNHTWSASPLPLHKRKWKIQTGSHSAEVLSKDIEGQRTRFHSEPSEPIFSMNKAVNIKGSLIKPATFSPTKSTDGAVMSGLKKGTLIKPAVFLGSDRSNNSVSTDAKLPTLRFVQGDNQNLLHDEKNNKPTKNITANTDSIIKPAHFLPKPAPSCSLNIPSTSSTKDRYSVDIPSDSKGTCLSANTSKCISSRDTNANYKMTPISDSKVFSKDENTDFPSTSKFLEGNRPAGLENWKYVCVQTDNGLLDDEQIYRNEILSKSGEVMGKIQDERRKSLVGINIQKNNVKELEKMSTPGTSTKTVLNERVKTAISEAKSVHSSVELEKKSTVGTSTKPDIKDAENVAASGSSSNTTISRLEKSSTQGTRPINTLNNPKKLSQINTDNGEKERVNVVNSDSVDEDDEDLPKFDFLKTARRQRDVSRAQSLNVKRTLVTDNMAGPSTSKNNSGGEMLKGRQRIRIEDDDLIIVGQKTKTSPDVIDMTGSSQSSVGSQEEGIINVEALPDVVDITQEPLDVVPYVFEINPFNRKEEPQKVNLLDHEPVEIVKPVNQIREKTPMSKTVSLQNRNTAPQAMRPTTQVQQPQTAINPAVTRQPVTATNLPPLPTMEKGPEEKLSDMVNEVLMMFPDVDPLYVKNLFLRFIGPEALNNVCNLLLENANYPRVQKGASSTTVSSEPPPKKKSYKNFYEDFSQPVTDFVYKNNCELLLQSEFKMISVKDIRILASHFNWHYAPMHKALSLIVKKGMEDKEDKGKLSLSQAVIVCDIPVGSEKKQVKATCLKCPRAVKCSLSSLPPELSEEYEFVKEKILEEAKDEDMKIAQQMNECEYAELGQLIECGCCFCEVPFDNMVQCYEGHLFCEDCLKNYANESVFGHGKTSLLCMSDGCDASFPKSQLDKALPANILDKYNDRVQEESINLAALDDLVRCPNCDFAALLDPNVKVFACQNSSCMKETCRHCKEDWKEHFGKRCDEIEKKDEVSLRIKFEEKMAMAKIRICHRCKAKFMKEEGCNKMTCKCGASMCYVCRKPNIDYKHFCQHLREPKKPCNKCTDCFLWSKAEEDDEIAIAEIRKECEALRVEKGYSLEKFIGAPEEPPSKKMKVK